MSDSVLNRYTSDSWSLELTGESSPLSRWTRRPVVKDEHFRLSLLGFETGAAPISWLEGDRPLLEQLHRAAESYVQSKLQTPTLTSPPVSARSPRSLALLEPDTELGTLAPLDAEPDSANPFALEADGSLCHRLHYSSPTTQTRTLKLSTIQLADLLDVLDRWQAETLALPQQTAAAPVVATRDFVVPAWGRIAASAAIALGAAGGGIYLLMSQPVETTTAQADVEAAANGAPADFAAGLPQVSTNPSGELPTGSQANQQIFSAPFLKQTPGGLGNVDASSLPGLESGQVATTPSADLTNNPDAFNADGLNPGDLNPGGFGSAGSNTGLNPGSIASANLPSSSTSGGIGSRAPSPNFSFTPLPSSTVRSSEPKPSVAPKPAAKPPATPAAKQSAPGDNAFADAKAELANAEAELAKNSDAARASAPNSSTSAGDNSAGDTIAAGGKPPASGPAESIATATAQSAPAPAPAPAPPKPPLPPRPMAAASAPFRQPTGANESTAIKTYFTSKWNPPADLQQSLQYQLILSGEGSIDKMNPLSPAAAQYAEKAGIPSVGEPFIPGSTEIQDATFVLTLGADGSVNVSVENVTPRR